MESLRRVFLRALVVSLVLTALIAIATLLFGSFDETDAQILLTTLAVAGFSLLALPPAVLLDRGELRPLATAALAAAAVAFVLVLVLVWTAIDEEAEGLWKAWGSCAVVAVALVQVSGVHLLRKDDDPPAVTRAAAASIATVLVAAVMADAAILLEVDNETYYRLFGALVVANVTLLLLQPVLRRMHGGRPAGATLVVEVPPGRADALTEELRGRGFRVERR